MSRAFGPGDRVRWVTHEAKGTVLDDHSEDFPDFVAIQWDNGDRTFAAPTHIKIDTTKNGLGVIRQDTTQTALPNT